MKYVYPLLKTLIFLLVMLAIGSFWAVGTFLPTESLLSIERIRAFKVAAPKETYTLLTYNMAHGQGIKKDPADWRSKDYTFQKLSELKDQLLKAHADFVLLQEVDLDSNRTYHINQADYLAQNTQYPFYACSVLWDKNYLPFPFFPVSQHLGRMKSANCILSKYEIIFHKRYIFDKPKSNPFWYNLGYIDRAAQWVQVKVGNQILNLINVHLEAFDISTRQEQARLLTQYFKNIPAPWILGGDFNALPSHAQNQGPFPDENINLSSDDTLKWIETQLQTKDIQAGFTYPSNQPTRQLDHLMGSGVQWGEASILADPMLASDHLGILVPFQLIEPK